MYKLLIKLYMNLLYSKIQSYSDKNNVTAHYGSLTTVSTHVISIYSINSIKQIYKKCILASYNTIFKYDLLIFLLLS